ncbi:hypothetical protein D7D52_34720 [Nocardia yunnanensis]|uniref:Uncharacterized protein n=2 Tax=Nocardia yunnanensis TaxID=2382165 RepID=A0A386ZKJ6_9NOCA|nr:hypothetical protein D7D52_34720 [Nocardia yunnanensis]
MWEKAAKMSIPDQALVLLLMKDSRDGFGEIERIWVADEIDYFDPFHAKALSYGTNGTRAVALVVDIEADGPGDNSQEHVLLTDAAACALREHGVKLEAAYVARGFGPKEPVWSLDTEEFKGKVPLFPAATPHPVYALAESLITKPANSLPRLADIGDED